jgi:hypothetical protein
MQQSTAFFVASHQCTAFHIDIPTIYITDKACCRFTKRDTSLPSSCHRSKLFFFRLHLYVTIQSTCRPLCDTSLTTDHFSLLTWSQVFFADTRISPAAVPTARHLNQSLTTTLQRFFVQLSKHGRWFTSPFQHYDISSYFRLHDVSLLIAAAPLTT